MFVFKQLLTQKYMIVVVLLLLGSAVYLFGSDSMFLDKWRTPRTSSTMKEGLQTAPLEATDVVTKASPVSLPSGTVSAMDPTSLLPRDPNSGWAINHPSTGGNQPRNLDMFKYGQDWGVNSIVVPRRNNNITGRVDPVIARVDTGPFNQAPDRERDPYQTGYDIQPSPIPGFTKQ